LTIGENSVIIIFYKGKTNVNIAVRTKKNESTVDVSLFGGYAARIFNQTNFK